MNKKITEDVLEVMHLIQQDSHTSQRKLSTKSGLSLGKVNYCLKALIDVGFIKIENFTNSKKKLNYMYIITPKGIREKTAITKEFIAKKQVEFDQLSVYLNKK
ncbi:EPS-associated transcriptional regulator, MarR family [SAR86 cluster bacterium SAR86E]|jgi:EPS-associated MarR family transcriptional regulator|uniref:EPS-associated transcriptional regulator, MarR family n=1 Tax=SAR86 cluster bacterium SAR86E TaxID=1208365 RepID=K6GG18_9GAMM|nr:EPS-associated transcriptional regulator, MarR family [SAR86 cluster bacterium SAR86E]